MKSKFKILFSIEVLNTYFSTGRWDDIKIIPLPDTERLMKKNQYTTRQIGNELLVIAKTDGTGKIYDSPALYERFSFALIPESINFLNFTNFPFSIPLFYFHNLNQNDFGGKHFITKPIANYSTANSYIPGDYAKSMVDGKVYEAIRINNGGAGSIAPDDAEAEPALPADPEGKLYSKNFWALDGDAQFVNTGDTKVNYSGTDYLLEQCGTIYNFKTSLNQKQHTVHVFAFKTDGLTYDKELISYNVKFDDDYNIVQISMGQFPSGVYRMQVDNDIRFVYFNSGITYGAGQMYIDIFNLPDSSSQAILDAGKQPLHTRFTIAFAARRVLWQYRTRTTTINTIADADGNYFFKSNGPKQFISLRPIPFSDSAMKSLVAKDGSLSITTPLPNPLVDRLLDKQNGIYATESFINF
jgi:hypothetical protein